MRLLAEEKKYDAQLIQLINKEYHLEEH